METMKSKVYVLLDSEGRITRCEGGYTMGNIRNIEDWVLIDEGFGDKYNLCQTNYFQKPIYTSVGAYRYRLVDGKAVECTAEEIAEQEQLNKPKVTAPRNVTAGEYITVNSVLYLAISNIPFGEPIITGQNAIETTIEEQLAELAKGE